MSPSAQLIRQLSITWPENIAKVAPITEGEDLTHAKSRKAAMDRAKIKLTDAAEEANGNVVSAVPS